MQAIQSKVLVVDDESSIRKALHTTLSGLGFGIEEAAGGEQAVSFVRSEHYDAALLDINMPGIGGIETCRTMRRLEPQLPILMLTVRDDAEDKIEALDAGADDYITKPFHVGELMARVRAAVRRSHAAQRDKDSVITIGEIELDTGRRLVRKRGIVVHLTPKEFDLLHCLMTHAGRPISHARLLTSVWGTEYGNELEYIRTFVRQLRKKLEDDPSMPEYLLTESYIGYRFRDPEEEILSKICTSEICTR
jgi:two-component system, OmpR family, KDP operon response regulator KdpE